MTFNVVIATNFSDQFELGTRQNAKITVRLATDTLDGSVRLATTAEQAAGTSTTTAATPKGVADKITAAIAAIPGDRYLTGLYSYNATTNIMTFTLSDNSHVDVDMTGLVNDAVASIGQSVIDNVALALQYRNDAQTAATASAASLTDFKTRYLGSFATDPTVDGNGNALVGGALYYKTATSKLRVYTVGPGWVDTDASAQAAVAIVLAAQTPAFAFSTTTVDADPGNGVVRFNNATLASVTFLYFDNLDNAANTVTGWLDTMANKGIITVTPVATPGQRLTFKITGGPIDGGGYRKIPVSFLSGGTLPANGATLAFTFNAAGLDGAAGTSNAITVRVATTGNIALNTFFNGATVDGVVVATNDWVLVKDQNTPGQYGIYQVPVSGTAPREPTRFNTWNGYLGVLITVQDGLVNGGMEFQCTSKAGGTLGITQLTFALLNPQITNTNMAENIYLPATPLEASEYYLQTGNIDQGDGTVTIPSFCNMQWSAVQRLAPLKFCSMAIKPVTGGLNLSNCNLSFRDASNAVVQQYIFTSIQPNADGWYILERIQIPATTSATTGGVIATVTALSSTDKIAIRFCPAAFPYAALDKGTQSQHVITRGPSIRGVPTRIIDFYGTQMSVPAPNGRLTVFQSLVAGYGGALASDDISYITFLERAFAAAGLTEKLYYVNPLCGDFIAMQCAFIDRIGYGKMVLSYGYSTWNRANGLTGITTAVIGGSLPKAGLSPEKIAMGAYGMAQYSSNSRYIIGAGDKSTQNFGHQISFANLSLGDFQDATVRSAIGIVVQRGDASTFNDTAGSSGSCRVDGTGFTHKRMNIGSAKTTVSPTRGLPDKGYVYSDTTFQATGFLWIGGGPFWTPADSIAMDDIIHEAQKIIGRQISAEGII